MGQWGRMRVFTADLETRTRVLTAEEIPVLNFLSGECLSLDSLFRGILGSEPYTDPLKHHFYSLLSLTTLWMCTEWGVGDDSLFRELC